MLYESELSLHSPIYQQDERRRDVNVKMLCIVR